ncbi:MAG: GAF domain-containing protein [Bacteroidetes bacterium]|nr:MAG: GAF domain-containing protein [Bacteroidota bacterium]
MNYTDILNHVREIIQTEGQSGLKNVCETLKSSVRYYNWVGIYYMNDATQILEIGPYAGAETEHTRIPYGKGICGQVAVSGETFTVQDVSEQDNYIACSIETKSEIVVPIHKGEKLVAQLDIDSHYASPFTSEDEDFLNAVCAEIAMVL